ncbi:D-tyrosyl-tRNA(Tyr) deacylase [Candidatus Peregrinibacteria bacterium CG10_big_fil_rev_8_21_14_0_10_42_8]|nr:MAG: D-tyrosyl-tRNA(Tyr) deacylase [Candidatus Peregrinibacteria bacterium CG10_big_fil_rev_8_21_14_0_10_42_8]
MKVLLQKVTEASVAVDGEIIGQIGKGYVLFIGIIRGDTSAQAALLAEKIAKLRLFDSESGKINDNSIVDIKGEILVVSQFTLAGSTKKGNRPDYSAAEAPSDAMILYEYFVRKLSEYDVLTVKTGEFGAYMDVSLINDGPVTLVLDR